MRISLRAALFLGALLALTAGCGDDDGSTPPEDAGSSPVDAGTEPPDATPGPVDAGGDPEDAGGDEDAGDATDAGGECPVGMTGADCTECAAGYQDADGDGACLLGCAATGADALDCGDHGSCEESAESGERGCACDDGYAGELCAECAPGYELSGGACVLNLPPTANLDLWMDADHAESLMLVGTQVAAWSDRRPSFDEDATMTVLTRRPGYVPNARAGRAAIRFDGVDDELTNPGYFGVSVADYEIIVACNPLGAGTPNGILGAAAAGSTTEWGVMLDQAPSNDFRLTHRSPVAATGGLVVTADRSAPLGPTWVAATHASSGTASMAIRAGDGAAIEETSTNVGSSMGFPSSLTLRIGRTGTGHMLGDIYEILVYTRRLSDAERQEVIDYLRAKWELQ